METVDQAHRVKVPRERNYSAPLFSQGDWVGESGKMGSFR